MDAGPDGHGCLSEGEAEVAGEPVDVRISGHLRRVYTVRQRWFADVEIAAGEGADSIRVPLAAVRLR